MKLFFMICGLIGFPLVHMVPVEAHKIEWDGAYQLPEAHVIAGFVLAHNKQCSHILDLEAIGKHFANLHCTTPHELFDFFNAVGSCPVSCYDHLIEAIVGQAVRI